MNKIEYQAANLVLITVPPFFLKIYSKVSAGKSLLALIVLRALIVVLSSV